VWRNIPARRATKMSSYHQNDSFRVDSVEKWKNVLLGCHRHAREVPTICEVLLLRVGTSFLQPVLNFRILMQYVLGRTENRYFVFLYS
jgi:hypothetical protein